MKRADEPQEPTRALISQVELISACYHRLFGAPLLPSELSGEALFRAAWDAPFVIVSHDTEVEPKFNFGNRQALQLWEMDLSEFLGLESRYSAEEEHREARASMLEQVSRSGFYADYRGVRASKRGRRFRIERALVFNLTDRDGAALGQAATFHEWTYL
jgi:hypothetical protein